MTAALPAHASISSGRTGQELVASRRYTLSTEGPSLEERLLTAELRPEDDTLERTLRPGKLDDFIGQEKLKDNLRIFIEAARARQ